MFKDKKIIVRLVLFLLFAGLAVWGITHGVVLIGHRESGYQTIAYEDTHGDILYKSGLILRYWAEGSSAEIRELTADVKKAYSDSLYRNYMLLDARETYDGVVNLATINAQPGEKVVLPAVLAEILQDAWEKTKKNEGYSVLAGALYDEWQTLLYLEDASEFDPSVNAAEAGRMKALSAWTAPDSSLALELETAADGTVTACLYLPEGYVQALSDMEITAPTLDLNLMHGACLMDLVAEDLRTAGYTDAVLYSKNGLCLMLRTGEMLQTYLREDDKQPALTAEGPVASAYFAAGEPLSDGYGGYILNGLKRHYWFDVRTGDFRNLVDRAVMNGPPDASALAWELIRLNCSENPEQMERPETINCIWMQQ